MLPTNPSIKSSKPILDKITQFLGIKKKSEKLLTDNSPVFYSVCAYPKNNSIDFSFKKTKNNSEKRTQTSITYSILKDLELNLEDHIKYNENQSFYLCGDFSKDVVIVEPEYFFELREIVAAIIRTSL